MNGSDIFKKLLSFSLPYGDFDWLENRGLSEVELLISVILTQNTNWKNVLKALENLRKQGIISLEQIDNLADKDLALLIKPSGFYNTKTKRLKNLVNKVLKEFQTLENFKTSVNREWLLNIKGLGYESVDSVLNYLCQREILVVDNYTNRLALSLGYEFEDYEELREFFESGIENDQKEICKLLGKKCELFELYQIFHALIIAFAKISFKGAKLNERGEEFVRKMRD